MNNTTIYIMNLKQFLFRGNDSFDNTDNLVIIQLKLIKNVLIIIANNEEFWHTIYLFSTKRIKTDIVCTCNFCCSL